MDRFFRDPSGDFVGLEETVRSHDDLIEFVDALRKDLSERRKRWEQSEVGEYLGGIALAVRSTVGEEYEVLNRFSITAGWLWVGRNFE